jgi:hypothetical protein
MKIRLDSHSTTKLPSTANMGRCMGADGNQWLSNMVRTDSSSRPASMSTLAATIIRNDTSLCFQ